jgi:hypothetical protein
MAASRCLLATGKIASSGRSNDNKQQQLRGLSIKETSLREKGAGYEGLKMRMQQHFGLLEFNRIFFLQVMHIHRRKNKACRTGK